MDDPHFSKTIKTRVLRASYQEDGTGRMDPGARRASSALKGVLVVTVLLMAAAFLVLSLGAIAYAYVALQLPDPDNLTGRAASFKSTKFFDRNGQLLYEMIDPQGGRRTIVKLDQISPYVRQATVATEDKNFYRHAGIDPAGILRAIWQNASEGEIVSGASTIPQQLVRMVLLSPAERSQRTPRRKVKEAILATEITRRYTKDAILQIYLNEIYYGNVAYGIEAAAETYFGKPAASLTLAESALLAGLPQAPSIYDPFVDPQAAKRRQSDVLNRMVEEGYITGEQAKAAWAAPLQYAPPQKGITAPHFVNYVRQQLEAKYGPDVLYRSGFQVYTTLDPKLQAIAERVARQRVKDLALRRVSNGALVAIRPNTGEILAMVGSIDFFDRTIDGQVNVTVRLRQPGSAIKPVTYAAAFERGWTPATMIMDVESSFPDGVNPAYRPVNYDNQFHGPVLVRTALANSYNVPAVKTLQFVGLPGMLDMAHRLGIKSLNRPDYGLSLTLGGGDVTLLEMAGAYAVFANQGWRVPPLAVLKLVDGQGHVIEDAQRQNQGQAIGQQVMSAQHAYLITDILSDREARVPAFGPRNVLNLDRPAAVKTGTTNDWRDNWTIGYTPDLVAGVWVGNNDNTPMQGVSGVTGAAPIWHDFMQEALQGTPGKSFPRPNALVTLEICANSGSLPGPACPQRRREVFVQTQLPPGPDQDLNQYIKIDRSTGQLATEFCPADLVEERNFFVLPAEYRDWAERHGYPQPPRERCTAHSFGPPQPPGYGWSTSAPDATPFAPAPTALWPTWPTAMPAPVYTPYAPALPFVTAYPTPSGSLPPAWLPSQGTPFAVTVIPDNSMPTEVSN